MAFELFFKHSSRRTPRRAALSLRLLTSIFVVAGLGVGAFSIPIAKAQDLSVVDRQSALAEQAQLADHIRLHPTDYDATYRYVVLSTELKDFEAGIGALERLLDV